MLKLFNVYMLLCYLQATSLKQEYQLNFRPTIGILAQTSEYPELFSQDDYSSIGDSYVNWIQSSGARVVPIPYTTNPEILFKIFKSINGLLFTGGSSTLHINTEFSKLQQTATYLVELAKQANLNGTYFPIWGTCLGFEMLLFAVTKNPETLSNLSSKNHIGNLTFTKKGLFSKLYGRMPKKLLFQAAFKASSQFNHEHGLSLDDLKKYPELLSFFDILTTTIDSQGTEFISSFEAKNFPFYGTQYHPEKNIFQWRTEYNINHQPGAIAITQYLANFLVSEARKNNQTFNELDEEAYLIYQYNPIYVNSGYQKVYIFKNNDTKYTQMPILKQPIIHTIQENITQILIA